MKYSSFLLAILFLVISPFVIYASSITLQEDGTTTKSVSVDINSASESVSDIKVVIQASEEVTVGKITNTSISCDTFKDSSSNNIIELTCTRATPTAVNGALAQIEFTTSSDTYSFTVDKEKTTVGDAAPTNVFNIEKKITETTTPPTTTTTPANTTTQTTTKATTEKSSSFMDYLPYVLIAGAGILLISIIGILLTRKKDSESTPPAATTATDSTPATPPVTPVNFDNIPQNLQNETQTDNMNAPQQTLADIVNSNPPQEVSTPTNEEKDLQDLLNRENPAGITPTEPTPVPPTIPESTPTEIVEPIQEVYTAPVTASNLPNIGSSSPTESTTPVTPSIGNTPEAQPVIQDFPTEPAPTPTDTAVTSEVDLQNAVNEQLNSMPQENLSADSTPVEPTGQGPVTNEETISPTPPQM